jgi:hypothetical protein
MIFILKLIGGGILFYFLFSLILGVISLAFTPSKLHLSFRIVILTLLVIGGLAVWGVFSIFH